MLRQSKPGPTRVTASAPNSMLRTRIITALVLLAVLLPILFLAPLGVAALVGLVLMALGCWEWARLIGWGGWRAVALAVAFGIVLATLAVMDPLSSDRRVGLAVVGAAAVFWCFVAPWWLARGIPAWVARRTGLMMALCWIVLAAAWWGLIAALQRGPVYLISVLAVVWVSDIAAYFAGRAFGRRKLAPTISPGKTWEGVAGAVDAVLVIGLGFALAAPADFPANFMGLMHAQSGLPGLALALVVLVALGIVGDLFESMLKRRAGVKDSSRLLPGHGGVLDRIDALLPVLPVAALIDMAATGRPFLF